MIKFRKLYRISNLKEWTLESFVSIWRSSPVQGLNLWSRTPREWELEEISKLGQIIAKISFSSVEDTLVWKMTNGNYSVKQVILKLTPSVERCKWSFIWKLRVPNKIKLFLWKVHMCILPTKGFFARRGVKIKEDDSCIFCNNSDETGFHIFQECHFAVSIWSMVCSWWQLQTGNIRLNSMKSI